MFSSNISSLLGNDDINVNKYITNKLNLLYPDIDPNTIDNELLENIIFNILNEDYANINKIKNDMFTSIEKLSEDKSSPDKSSLDKSSNDIFSQPTQNICENKKLSKYEQEIIKQNILMADEIIPEMYVYSNLIYLSGRLNGIKINTMIDTGASSCVIFKSVVDKCGLDYLIDTSTSTMIQGANGVKPSVGTIWFMEIDVEVNKNNWVTIPISVEVIDDSDTIKANKIIEEHTKSINEILKIDEANNNNDVQELKKNSHEFDLILGMTFLKSYRANIDFSSMTITLNKNIKIKFN